MTTARPAFATTPEVARLIGTDPWNLNRWAAHGWLQVEQMPGSGHRLSWTPEAIRHAAIVVQLVTSLGSTPAVAASIADQATSNTGASWHVNLDGHLLVIGDLPWVPEPPEDPDL